MSPAKASKPSFSKQTTGDSGSSSRATIGKQGMVSPAAGAPGSPSGVTPSKEAHSEGPTGISQIVPETVHPEVQKYKEAASLRKRLSDFTMKEDKEVNSVAYFMRANPVVIRIESSKSFSIKRIVRHLQCVNAQWPNNLILSIFRTPRNRHTFIELLSATYRDKILSSHRHTPFPFNVDAVSHVTTSPNETLSQWLVDHATCQLRIDIKPDDVRMKTVIQIWEKDKRKDGGSENACKWNESYVLEQQRLPTRASNTPLTMSIDPLPEFEERTKFEDKDKIPEFKVRYLSHPLLMFSYTNKPYMKSLCLI